MRIRKRPARRYGQYLKKLDPAAREAAVMRGQIRRGIARIQDPQRLRKISRYVWGLLLEEDGGELIDHDKGV